MINLQTIIICTLLLIALAFPAFSGGLMYTSGSGFFAISEQHLIRAKHFSRSGNWRNLESLVNLGVIKVVPQGIPVEMDTYRNGTYRVQFLNSPTIWWTTGQGLMNKHGESYVR